MKKPYLCDMKRLMIGVILCAMVSTASAQKLMTGDRAPQLQVSTWLDGKSASSGPRLVEFFHSASAPSLARLNVLSDLATKNPDLNVVLVTREEASAVATALGAGEHPYKVAIDQEGKTFAEYGVQYLPFAVLIDAKGRIAWFGNPAQLSQSQIESYLK